MRNALLSLLPLLFVAACSGKVVIGENGSTQGSLKKNPDGSATGNGQTCSYGGTTSNIGQKFTAPDGCNTCTCAADGAYCTEMACVSDGGAGTCNYEGKTYKKGDSWQCSDGCNTCSCGEDGLVASTLIGCNVEPPDCSGKEACGPAPGMPNMLCADGTMGGPVCEAKGPVCSWQIKECTCKDPNGKTHKPGESFTIDCSTCSCDATGNVMCTANACACPPDGTVVDCEPPTTNKPMCQGSYHDWIVKNCPNVSFAL